MSDAAAIAEALGVLLQRRFRASLYVTLTRGLHAALDAATYPVLSGAARLEPISAAELGHEIGLDRSIVSRRAAALVDARLLRTAPDPRDARATLLSLTPAGRRIVATLRRRLVAALDARLAAWPARDRRELARLLAKLVEPGSLLR